MAARGGRPRGIPQSLKLARFGDNMRYVAVTEGDKTEAELRFGVQVNTWGVNELAEAVAAASEADVDALVAEYEELYDVVPELRKGGDRHQSLRDGAAIELGLRSFLEEGGFGAFTTSFEDLGALKQLPGLAVQRLMAEGYGFGAEGDWKTACSCASRTSWARACPAARRSWRTTPTTSRPATSSSSARTCSRSRRRSRPRSRRLEIHPLGIGGKEDPVRLRLHRRPRPRRRRGDERHARPVPPHGERRRERRARHPLPKLPVGRAVWKPAPDFQTSAAAWLTAGAAHHTVMSTAVGVEVFRDFADMAKVELLVIDEDTTLPGFQREVRWNQAYYRLAQGL